MTDSEQAQQKRYELPLCIGKPDDGSRLNADSVHAIQAATFTRFVLPFAYRIVPSDLKKPHPDLYYEVNSQRNLSFIKRRKYFTHETSLTLYDRAIWLDMSENWKQSPWGKEAVTVKLYKGTEYRLGMLPPRVILFESGRAKTVAALASSNSASFGEANLLHTGFLCVDLYFPWQDRQPQLDDLLMLNEYFRYFHMPYDKHADYFRNVFGNVPIEYTTSKNNAKVGNLDKLERYFERWKNLLTIPVFEDDQYYQLFPDSWAENAAGLAYSKADVNREQNWHFYSDNRCYVWTAAFLPKGGTTLREAFFKKDDNRPLMARDFGHWIRLLNVDNPDFSPEGDPIQNSHRNPSDFERDWADKRTYKRWQHSGAWYGCCPHAGAVISTAEYTFEPYSSYYFDTSLLLFYTKTTLFRFSTRLSNIFHLEQHNHQSRGQLRKTREQFSKFTVLYRFPLLSNQQQSIEMFELNRKYFDID
ncbi:MAG: hypothetical protein ACRESZ_04095 [Methylococcales bacterium]